MWLIKFTRLNLFFYCEPAPSEKYIAFSILFDLNFLFKWKLKWNEVQFHVNIKASKRHTFRSSLQKENIMAPKLLYKVGKKVFSQNRFWILLCEWSCSARRTCRVPIWYGINCKKYVAISLFYSNLRPQTYI